MPAPSKGVFVVIKTPPQLRNITSAILSSPPVWRRRVASVAATIGKLTACKPLQDVPLDDANNSYKENWWQVSHKEDESRVTIRSFSYGVEN
ncbi:hypothetical protein e2017b09.tmp0211 [Eimeria tenella]|uniref:Uncharacterized protein n=1 Tax=Eimeria tenella TaxID=5802 RepID=C8TDX0_EIMTE|nr:hypothetical protein e2017b09.tmp0211 [Eimeria tenella]